MIETEFGSYTVNYHELKGQELVSFVYGDISKGTPVVHIHSSCLFGETFHSLHCDCHYQLTETMRAIQRDGAGAIIYSYQEGRGIGLKNKIKSMELERTTGCDTVDAFKQLGYDQSDLRDFKREVAVLQELGTAKEIYSFSGNPKKRLELEAGGFVILEEYEIPEGIVGAAAQKERQTKKEKLGYSYKN